KDGKAKRPIMLHRVIYGAIERFIGIVTEHLNGNFPLWLSPVQVKVLTITDKQVSFAKKVVKELSEVGLRVELDDRTETMGKKVREAQLGKVNYIVTIGEKEVAKKKLAVRSRDGKVKFGVAMDGFVKSLVKEVKERK
ncbi:threonine--tRNA ligase, partial [Candidatus Woesearchaeota archaeon]|nr:threonine--tRNA ligase [Candidatus Woesearchaeota archaeon]